MMNDKAFTMVEMLVALIIALILILAMGVISSTGLSSNRKQRVALDTYSDIHYGFKLMENKIRSATSTVSWASNQLTMSNVDNSGVTYTSIFKVQANGANKDLVYLSDYVNNALDKSEVIYAGTDASLVMTVNVVGSKITVHLSGTKEKFKFNLADTITRRAQ